MIMQHSGKLIVKHVGVFLVALLLVVFVAAPSALAAVTINEHDGLTAASQPHGIALGPDGNMWFTEFNRDHIGKMTPDGSLVEEYPLTAGAFPHDITAGPDNRLWFTEYAHESGVGPTGVAGIGAIDSAGNVDEYPLGAGDIRPHDIVAAPDGNLWFTKIGTHTVGRIQTNGTLLPDITFSLPGTVDPYGIAVGPDGNVWVTDWGTNDQIIKMDLSGNVINTFPITGGYSQPYAITAGADGNLWFTLEGGSQDAVAKITPSGQIDYFPLTANGGNSNPQYIIAGPDGNVWFAEESAHQIGMITPDGVITEYPTPTQPSGSFGIAVGPNNTIWFTEATLGANQLGVIAGLDIPSPPTPPSPPPPSQGGTTPGAPDTGFGVLYNPVQTLIIYGVIATSLLSLALVIRTFATRTISKDV